MFNKNKASLIYISITSMLWVFFISLIHNLNSLNNIIQIILISLVFVIPMIYYYYFINNNINFLDKINFNIDKKDISNLCALGIFIVITIAFLQSEFSKSEIYNYLLQLKGNNNLQFTKYNVFHIIIVCIIKCVFEDIIFRGYIFLNIYSKYSHKITLFSYVYSSILYVLYQIFTSENKISVFFIIFYFLINIIYNKLNLKYKNIYLSLILNIFITISIIKL